MTEGRMTWCILFSMDLPKPGEYEHYKQKRYRVIGVARHSETGERLVVYQKLYDDRGLSVRPLEMFLENVEVDGQTMPRFRYVGE
jgi:hypothetical protein